MKKQVIKLGYEDIVERLVAKREEIEDRIRLQVAKEVELIDTLLAELTEEIEVEEVEEVNLDAQTEEFENVEE